MHYVLCRCLKLAQSRSDAPGSFTGGIIEEAMLELRELILPSILKLRHRSDQWVARWNSWQRLSSPMRQKTAERLSRLTGQEAAEDSDTQGTKNEQMLPPERQLRQSSEI